MYLKFEINSIAFRRIEKYMPALPSFPTSLSGNSHFTFKSWKPIHCDPNANQVSRCSVYNVKGVTSRFATS